MPVREQVLAQSIAASQPASSRVMDTDFAKDQSERVMLQILQATSSAALAQADVSQASVLDLINQQNMRAVLSGELSAISSGSGAVRKGAGSSSGWPPELPDNSRNFIAVAVIEIYWPPDLIYKPEPND